MESVIKSDVVPRSLPVAVAIRSTGINACVDFCTSHPARDIYSNPLAASCAVYTVFDPASNAASLSCAYSDALAFVIPATVAISCSKPLYVSVAFFIATTAPAVTAAPVASIAFATFVAPFSNRSSVRLHDITPFPDFFAVLSSRSSSSAAPLTLFLNPLVSFAPISSSVVYITFLIFQRSPRLRLQFLL